MLCCCIGSVASGGDAKTAALAAIEYSANKSYVDRWSAFYEQTLNVRSSADYFMHVRRRIPAQKIAITDVYVHDMCCAVLCCAVVVVFVFVSTDRLHSVWVGL